MKTTRSSKRGWPREITVGRISVTIYKRTMPNGVTGFLVADYTAKKRRLVSKSTEDEAVELATRLARQLSERDTKAASMTEAQAVEYVCSAAVLQSFGVSVSAAAETIAACLKKVGELGAVHEAVKFFAQHHKSVVPKRVADVVNELVKVKEARNISPRYKSDLRGRLDKFAKVFQKNVVDIRTEDIQTWLDEMKSLKGKKLSNVSYSHNRQMLHLFFKFAVARGYAHANPVDGVEKVKVKRGATLIFKPDEIAKLLAAASPEFLPSLAIGAFAGLRSAEIERLDWSDIDLAQRHIILSAEKAKTAARRIIPIADNLAAWLASYSGKKGKVWQGAANAWLYRAQQDCATAAGVKWKQNGLRHSYVSYRLAQTQNAAQVALECGNSPQMIFQHYRELVRPADAVKWFSVMPDIAENVVTMKSGAEVAI